jgi:DNA helicase-2/ATP-dependent DNA helicase PcrA
VKEIPEDITVKKGGYNVAAGATAYRNNYSSSYMSTTVTRKTSMYTPPKSNSHIELNKGDMVMHAAFGRGLVLSVIKMGGDALLEIAFDDIGTKKLMANTAAAHMKRL